MYKDHIFCGLFKRNILQADAVINRNIKFKTIIQIPYGKSPYAGILFIQISPVRVDISVQNLQAAETFLRADMDTLLFSVARLTFRPGSVSRIPHGFTFPAVRRQKSCSQILCGISCRILRQLRTCRIFCFKHAEGSKGIVLFNKLFMSADKFHVILTSSGCLRIKTESADTEDN